MQKVSVLKNNYKISQFHNFSLYKFCLSFPNFIPSYLVFSIVLLFLIPSVEYESVACFYLFAPFLAFIHFYLFCFHLSC